VIELLVDGRLTIWADGQMELPRQPPFSALAVDPAAFVTIDLLPESPRCIRLFNEWYIRDGALDVIAGDGHGTWIHGRMRCVKIEIHEGIEITREWSEPLRRMPTETNHCLLYRPQPLWQPIAKDIHRYVLATERYEWAPPVEHRKRLLH
jgi:hypothetical protein